MSGMSQAGGGGGSAGITPVVFSTYSKIGLGVNLAAWAVAAPTSLAWQSANTALFFPIEIEESVTVVKLWWINGGVASGNVDIGIYDATTLARKVSIGSTAQGTISVIQEVDVADTVLAAGRYYIAIVLDNTTGTLLWTDPGTLSHGKALGVAQMGAAFVLPDPAVLVVPTFARIPVCGGSLRTQVA